MPDAVLSSSKGRLGGFHANGREASSLAGPCLPPEASKDALEGRRVVPSPLRWRRVWEGAAKARLQGIRGHYRRPQTSRPVPNNPVLGVTGS